MSAPTAPSSATPTAPPDPVTTAPAVTAVRSESPSAGRVRVHTAVTRTRPVDVRFGGDVATGATAAPSSPTGITGAPLTEDQAKALATLPHSKQRDPFEGYYATFSALEPPVQYEVICELLHNSDVLEAAVDAKVTNVAAFGLQVVPYSNNIPPEKQTEVEEERRRLAAWLEYAGSGMSFDAVRARARLDFELFGDGYYEVLRDRKGKVVGVEHAMTRYIRKTKRGDDFVEVEEPVRTADGSFTTRTVLRRYRLYIQWTSYSRFTYFKEYGDPRPIRADNGKPDPDARYEELANELIVLSRYATDPTYGRPVWRGAANSVAGRTAAGSVNYDLFDNKAIPPLLITVQGAELDDGAVERIAAHFDGTRGRKNWHAPLILEAVSASTPDPSDPMGISRPGSIPRIDVKSLMDDVQKDASFLQYRLACAKDVAMSLRLPPLYMGMEGTYNFATAQAARQVAEEQVFQPERAYEDGILNATILPALGARWCKFASKGPPLLTEEVLLKLIETGVTTGALTVAQVSDLLEPMLGMELSSPETWRKLPAVLFQSLAKSGLVPADVAEQLGEVVRVGPEPAAETAPAVPTGDAGAQGGGASDDGGGGGGGGGEPAGTQDGAVAADETQANAQGADGAGGAAGVSTRLRGVSAVQGVRAVR